MEAMYKSPQSRLSQVAFLSLVFSLLRNPSAMDPGPSLEDPDCDLPLCEFVTRTDAGK